MVLDNDGLYDRLNCYDNLELYARIYSISNRKKVINDLLERVGLIESSKTLIPTMITSANGITTATIATTTFNIEPIKNTIPVLFPRLAISLCPRLPTTSLTDVHT